MPEDDFDLAYARGDFRSLRRAARAQLADPEAAAETRERARGWIARISVDVYVYATLGFALVLFCAIVLRYGFF